LEVCGQEDATFAAFLALKKNREFIMALTYALKDSRALNLLITREFHPELIDPLNAAYTLRHAYDKDERKKFLEQHGGEIEAVLTSGMVGLSADEIALMPKLKVVQTFAVGYETVDTAAAKARGIMVCNTAGSNADCVADHAMGMMIAVTRKFAHFNNLAKAGTWDDVGNSTPMVSGKKLGIVGLGAIGKTLAGRRPITWSMPISSSGSVRPAITSMSRAARSPMPRRSRRR
jgi:lactate dehydrogenase-like 2-hydroxyacid dehydrogenase